MSFAPDVSTMNETLAKRKGSTTGEADTFSAGSPGAVSLADEIISPVCHR